MNGGMDRRTGGWTKEKRMEKRMGVWKEKREEKRRRKMGGR